MATIFLILIYATFISLGLPDSLLGAAWPSMRLGLGVSLDSAGLVSIAISTGTVVSSLFSERIVRRFGTGKITAVSVLATSGAMMGFAFTPSFGWLFLFSIPLGLGAGAIDAALNNYVAMHYAARHMSWLHSFWGLGAFIGPMIMSSFLRDNSATNGAVWMDGWRGGYFTVAVIQLVLAIILVAALPMWKKQNGGMDKGAPMPEKHEQGVSGSVLRIPGVKAALLSFFVYCACESMLGLWSSSFLVEARGTTDAYAAKGTALYFAGIMAGRILSGFLTSRFSSKLLIRAGIITLAAGSLVFLLPLPMPIPLAALAVIGIGCAPIFPSLIHETPARYGAVNSQKIIGFQMAGAYIGATLMPPIIGFLSARIGVWIVGMLPFVFTGIMLALTEHINRIVKSGKKSENP